MGPGEGQLSVPNQLWRGQAGKGFAWLLPGDGSGGSCWCPPRPQFEQYSESGSGSGGRELQ